MGGGKFNGHTCCMCVTMHSAPAKVAPCSLAYSCTRPTEFEGAFRSAMQVRTRPPRHTRTRGGRMGGWGSSLDQEVVARGGAARGAR